MEIKANKKLNLLVIFPLVQELATHNLNPK